MLGCACDFVDSKDHPACISILTSCVDLQPAIDSGAIASIFRGCLLRHLLEVDSGFRRLVPPAATVLGFGGALPFQLIRVWWSALLAIDGEPHEDQDTRR